MGPLSHPSFWGPKKALSFSLGCSFRVKVPTRKFGDEPERLDTIQLLFFGPAVGCFRLRVSVPDSREVDSKVGAAFPHQKMGPKNLW